MTSTCPPARLPSQSQKRAALFYKQTEPPGSERRVVQLEREDVVNVGEIGRPERQDS